MNMVVEEKSVVGMQVRSGPVPVLKQVDMRGTVSGLMLELSVEQHFHNVSTGDVEVVYTFPLPVGAVLLDMVCTLGERQLCATVLAAPEGERRYEEALEQGDLPVMVQAGGEGYSTINIGNLQAGASCVVRYRYAQLLAFAQGQIRIAIPTVIAPRYGNPARAGQLPHQYPVTDMLAEYPCTLQLQLLGALQAGAISSPSHALKVRMAEGAVRVDLDKSARMDRDLVVLVDGLQGQSLAVSGKDDVSGAQVVLASLCAAAAGAVVARPLAMKVLVDCSGSMAGDSIAATRMALREILDELQPQDSLNLSRFGCTVHHLHRGIRPVDADLRNEGRHWVAALDADLGGTELELALGETYALAGEADILLLTDGQISDAESLLEQARRAGQRIFVVAIGMAPAGCMLQRLADETAGACEFVSLQGAIQEAILRTFRRMRQPPVQDLALDWQMPSCWQVAPRQRLFAEETTHALAGFTDGLPGQVRLHWQRAGQPGELTLMLGAQMPQLAGDTLARVAAAMRLPGLTAQQQLQTALDYRLLTDVTRMLLVHERSATDQASEAAALSRVSQMLPAGWGGTAKVALRAPAVFRMAAAPMFAASEMNGMEQYDIPAFLREDVNESGDGALVRQAEQESLQRFIGLLAQRWEARQLDHIIPAELAAWSDSLSVSLSQMLVGLLRSGVQERQIIAAFLSVVAEIARQQGYHSALCRWLEQHAVLTTRRLQAQVSDGLTGLTGWSVTRGLPLPLRLVRRMRHERPPRQFA
ncbi:VIT and vWA domain-containing protein [Duganella qianjiadongensis]|uniref:VWA domain-containing protein n=1 Tax=Duganella qianjiadongensis TaxID=2692176 RepID=A0ABW9VNY1_9BURK|nr:VIT and VWA domain-containing protein [Duganella qianjiadongensis]MYM40665.1 VWA domain-containing protein [Duganella qianjiadongensis]